MIKQIYSIRKVQAAVGQIGSLKQENTSLKTKLDEYQKRIGELEVLIDRIKQDQQEIEDGILRALEKLDHLEDSSQETVAPQPNAGDATTQDAPVEEAAPEQDGNELDIF